MDSERLGQRNTSRGWRRVQPKSIRVEYCKIKRFGTQKKYAPIQGRSLKQNRAPAVGDENDTWPAVTVIMQNEEKK